MENAVSGLRCVGRVLSPRMAGGFGIWTGGLHSRRLKVAKLPSLYVFDSIFEMNSDNYVHMLTELIVGDSTYAYTVP